MRRLLLAGLLCAFVMSPAPALATSAPKPSPTAQAFYDYGTWFVAYPRHCALLIRTYGAQMQQVNDHGTLAHMGFDVVREINRDCRERKYGDVKFAGRLLEVWALNNGATSS